MRRVYSKKFKDDVINKVIKSGLSVKEVASEEGIPTSTLYKWVSKYKEKDVNLNTENVKAYNSNYIKQLQLDNNIFKKALFLPRKKEAIFDFIYENKDSFPIQRMCNLLNVSSSGYYKYIKNIPSHQALKRNKITRLIKDIYVKHGPNIGSPKITEIINANEQVTSQATVARILSANKADWNTSFSKFHNKDVVLSFQNKDTVLDSNTSTYHHKELAREQINNFLNNSYFSNLRKHNGASHIEVKSFTKNDNLLIRGDNLHALHLLKSTYKNSIQLIYIDVPYRTLRSDLSYHDSYSRSDYLLLLKNRLEIAQKLLKRTGSIFIHCDDNEQAYIKVLCDEIFGDENFINQIIWKRTTSQQNTAQIATKKEYILVYSKNRKKLKLNKQIATDKQLNSYKYSDHNGTFRIDKIQDKKNGYYNYTINDPKGQAIQSRWVYPLKTFKKFQTKNLIYWSRNNIPYKKVYLTESLSEKITTNDLWTDTHFYGTTKDATIELENTIGKNSFTYPKPEKLLKNIIKLSTKKDDIVLDFYAGSGTTGVVSAKLGRKFILVESEFRNNKLIAKRINNSGNLKKSFISCQIKSSYLNK